MELNSLRPTIHCFFSTTINSNKWIAEDQLSGDMESECIIFIVVYNILSLPEATEGIARQEAQLKELKDRVEEREEDDMAKIMAGLDECE